MNETTDKKSRKVPTAAIIAAVVFLAALVVCVLYAYNPCLFGRHQFDEMYLDVGDDGTVVLVHMCSRCHKASYTSHELQYNYREMVEDESLKSEEALDPQELVDIGNDWLREAGEIVDESASNYTVTATIDVHTVKSYAEDEIRSHCLETVLGVRRDYVKKGTHPVFCCKVVESDADDSTITIRCYHSIVAD